MEKNNENWEEIDENSYDDEQDETKKNDGKEENQRNKENFRGKRGYYYNRGYYQPWRRRANLFNTDNRSNEFYFSKALNKKEYGGNVNQPHRKFEGNKMNYKRNYDYYDNYDYNYDNKNYQNSYKKGQKRKEEEEGRTPIFIEKTDGTKKIILVDSKKDNANLDYKYKK